MTIFIYGFWFGCGFIAAVLLIAAVLSLPQYSAKKGRDEINAKLFAYWEKSLGAQAAQIAAIEAMNKSIRDHGSSNNSLTGREPAAGEAYRAGVGSALNYPQEK